MIYNEDPRKREDYVQKYFGQVLTTLRKEAKITQEELADMVGLSRTSIVNIEAGRQEPNISLLFTICCIFNKDYSDMLPFLRSTKIIENEESVIITKIIKKKNFVFTDNDF